MVRPRAELFALNSALIIEPELCRYLTALQINPTNADAKKELAALGN